LEQAYSNFALTTLAEADIHTYLITIIEKDQSISNKKRACKVLGGKVIVGLIKNKKYRKPLTSFIDSLRLSKNFRDRQLYLVTARTAFR